MASSTPNAKIVSLGELSQLGDRLRAQNKKLVSTNGCFDLLHIGHIKYLEQAKALGDLLIVGVNSDESVRKLKGPTRPLFPAKVRLEQLAALESVDTVFEFPHDTPVEFLTELQPQLHVKGGDYQIDELPEAKVVESYGGRIEVLGFVPGVSTTSIIENLRNLDT